MLAWLIDFLWKGNVPKLLHGPGFSVKVNEGGLGCTYSRAVSSTLEKVILAFLEFCKAL